VRANVDCDPVGAMSVDDRTSVSKTGEPD